MNHLWNALLLLKISEKDSISNYKTKIKSVCILFGTLSLESLPDSLPGS